MFFQCLLKHCYLGPWLSVKAIDTEPEGVGLGLELVLAPICKGIRPGDGADTMVGAVKMY